MKRKKFENADLGVKFTLPEKLTTRQILQYIQATRWMETDDAQIRAWQAALPLIEDWECETIPDPAGFDLDSEGTWRTVSVVIWTGNSVSGHVAEMDDVPKNS